MSRRRWPESIAIPAAIIGEPLSPLALRLWLLLAKWQEAYPSNQHLLSWLPKGTEEGSLRRAKRELIAAGLLSVERRFLENGRETSSLYELLHPDDREEGQIAPLPPGETDLPGEGEIAPLGEVEMDPPNKKERTLKKRTPLTPAQRGTSSSKENPRARGESLRQKGLNPREVSRKSARRRNQFRMARTVGAGFARTDSDESGVRAAIEENLPDVELDVIEAGLTAWRAEREAVSA